jgi:cathepsin D
LSTSADIIGQGYWEINMDGIEGNGQTRLTNIKSIMDTGCTLILGDPHRVAQLHSLLGGTDASETVSPGIYTCMYAIPSSPSLPSRLADPCNKFPSISFTFGGRSFPISPSSLNRGRVSPDSNQCVCGIVGIVAHTGEKLFQLASRCRDIFVLTFPFPEIAFWIIGDIFLLNVYTTFDVENLRVGFAQLV